jgi:hypothetical protein
MNERIGRAACSFAIVFFAVAFPVYGAIEVDFGSQVFPILAERCFECHAEATQKGELRLDSPDWIRKGGEFGEVVAPGDVSDSAIIELITLPVDDKERMPKKSDPLSDDEIEILKGWVEQGANYDGWTQEMSDAANRAIAERAPDPKDHWAFKTPVRPEVPAASDGEWVRNPIDHFILAKLDEKGLSPSPEAGRAALLRRASLDVTGLPPTIARMEHTTTDYRDGWYEFMVRELLDSPHFGERWARHWLDNAQYADSDGFEKDKPRSVTAWRDWVIEAFNDDKPYNEFIIEQVAGDLLPRRYIRDQVATGFLRNNFLNEEGGADPEQFRMEGLFNRMDVLGRSVLGLTVGCAQCHTHKYDPITHAEYYRMLAFLNSTHEATIPVPTPDARNRQNEAISKIRDLETGMKKQIPDWKERVSAWAQQFLNQPEPAWHALEFEFDDTSAGGQKALARGDGSYIFQSYAPTRHEPKMVARSPISKITAIRLELMIDWDLPRRGPGRSIYGAAALSEFEIRTAPDGGLIKDYKKWTPIKIASAIADVNPVEKKLGPEFPSDRNAEKWSKDKRVTGPVVFAIDGDRNTAWTTDINPLYRNMPRNVLFTLEEPLEIDAATQLAVNLAQNHGGWNSNDNQNYNIGRFRISVTDATDLPTTLLPIRARMIAEKTDGDWSDVEFSHLFSDWLKEQPEYAKENELIESLWWSYPEFDTQLVMREMETPRVTHRLERGDFLSPAEVVEPGVPAFLHPMKPSDEPTRLQFARWLVDTKSPTTARALVNRIWQHYFGTGLVSTSSDLGFQGETPSHGDLLDWLAVEFMQSGWSMKHIHKLILTSATYRQASHVTPELYDIDRDNRLLARGSRYRVDGEVVRDIALAASGLLNDKIGGANAHPPVPQFIYEPPTSYGWKDWDVDTGEDRYRRAMYTFRFRSSPYPMLQVFDTPDGNAPCTRRDVTNSPLQALTTLNEALFFECASALARLTLSEGGETDDQKISYAFKRCLTREPSKTELKTLVNYLDRQRKRIRNETLDAIEITSVAPGGLVEESDEHAAWTLLSRVLLNLDETIVRQ